MISIGCRPVTTDNTLSRYRSMCCTRDVMKLCQCAAKPLADSYKRMFVNVRTRLYHVPSISKYTRTVYCVLGRMARSVNSTRTYYRVMMITRGDLEYEIPNNEV